MPEVTFADVTGGTGGAVAPEPSVSGMNGTDGADGMDATQERGAATQERGAAEPAIVVEGLHKRYGRKIAVGDIGLRVERGEIFGILGANGAGKTTTVETIAGLRRAGRHDRGTVRVLGLDPQRDRAALRQVLGVQLQDARLHDALTVDELIGLYRSFYPHPRPATELVGLVGLEEQRRVRFDKLSGGQQQRLSIALALAGRPRVVILDELTTGLDPKARRQMWATVERLRDEGTTILLVSHAMEEVERLCDRIALLDAGRVLATGTPAALVAEVGATDLDEAFVALTGTHVEAEEAA